VSKLMWRRWRMKRQIPKTNKTVPKSLVGSPNLAKQVGVLHLIILKHRLWENDSSYLLKCFSTIRAVSNGNYYRINPNR
jgi:hypothetical protein